MPNMTRSSIQHTSPTNAPRRRSSNGIQKAKYSAHSAPQRVRTDADYPHMKPLPPLSMLRRIRGQTVSANEPSMDAISPRVVHWRTGEPLRPRAQTVPGGADAGLPMSPRVVDARTPGPHPRTAEEIAAANVRMEVLPPLGEFNTIRKEAYMWVSTSASAVQGVDCGNCGNCILDSEAFGSVHMVRTLFPYILSFVTLNFELTYTLYFGRCSRRLGLTGSISPHEGVPSSVSMFIPSGKRWSPSPLGPLIHFQASRSGNCSSNAARLRRGVRVQRLRRSIRRSTWSFG